MSDQKPFRKEHHGFTWDLLVPSNIDTEIQANRDWEPKLTNYIEQYVGAGMNVVDVGANIGWFTLIIASRVTKTGQVHAFEPEPSFFRRLRSHLVLNFNSIPDNVYIYSCGLAEIKCLKWIVKNGSPYYSSAGTIDEEPKDVPDDVKITKIRCLTLDAIWDRSLPVHFIKIDVDGYELKVLKGAEKTITANRPRMILEISKDAEEICQLLKSWNYDIKLESSMRVASFVDIQKELQRTAGSINIIAEPKR